MFTTNLCDSCELSCWGRTVAICGPAGATVLTMTWPPELNAAVVTEWWDMVEMPDTGPHDDCTTSSGAIVEVTIGAVPADDTNLSL